jgi:hypothetical protein
MVVFVPDVNALVENSLPTSMACQLCLNTGDGYSSIFAQGEVEPVAEPALVASSLAVL